MATPCIEQRPVATNYEDGVLSTRLEPVAGYRRDGYLKSTHAARWTYRARYRKANVGGPVSE
jgi:hypothetical protein